VSSCVFSVAALVQRGVAPSTSMSTALYFGLLALLLETDTSVDDVSLKIHIPRDLAALLGLRPPSVECRDGSNSIVVVSSQIGYGSVHYMKYSIGPFQFGLFGKVPIELDLESSCRVRVSHDHMKSL
jgi:hypothetical protein